MLKKTIKYVDYNGNDQTEDFYFNLSKAECLKLEMSEPAGLTATIKQLATKMDNPTKMYDIFEKIIKTAIGEKSADGKHFVKNADIANGFISTEAYTELVIELFGDPKKAEAFFTALVPAENKTQANIPATK